MNSNKCESRISFRIDKLVKSRFIQAAKQRGLNLTNWLIEAGNEKADREAK